MKKMLFLMITALILMGCKSKQAVKEFETQKEMIKITSTKDSIQNISKDEEKKTEKKKDISEKKKETETEIEVKGKAETNKPLELHEIKDGDTLQTIKVVGNAEVVIRSKNKQSNQEKNESNSETLTEKLKEFSQNIITENHIKERVSEMKKKTTEVTTKTGTFWSFGIVAIFVVVALVIIGILIYFKK